MEKEGNIIIPVIGYLVTILIHPIIGLVYGAILVFYKKDTPLYQKHGRFIIYFSILVFIITLVIKLLI